MSAMEFVLRFTLSHPGPVDHHRRHGGPGHLAGNIATAEKGPSLPTSTKRRRSFSRGKKLAS
jgi:hypothetical protein